MKLKTSRIRFFSLYHFFRRTSYNSKKNFGTKKNLSSCYEKWQYSIIDYMKSMSNLSLFDRLKSRFQMGFSKYWRIYISNLKQVDNLPVYRYILNSDLMSTRGHCFFENDSVFLRALYITSYKHYILHTHFDVLINIDFYIYIYN